MNLIGGLRYAGGLFRLFLFGGLLFLFVGGCSVLGVGGGHAKLFFEKLHAQFAYYKSPELGLNLSGS